MQRLGSWAASAVMIVALTAPAVAETPAAPIRHLVYNFTYGSASDQTVQTAGISQNGDNSPGGATSASGVADVHSGNGDEGTIVADVMLVQPDTGMLVQVSEQARNERTALVAECAVYGNTTVVCDPSKKVNAEEMLLLRLLGSNFVDASQIDDKNHWRVAHSDGDGVLTDDFTIGSTVNGIMQISSTRVFKQLGAHIVTTTSDSKITYDFNRTVPTAVSEDAITREEQGMGNYNTTDIQTTLSLQTDSLAKH